MAIQVYQLQSPLSQVTQTHYSAYLAGIEQALGEKLTLCDMSAFQQAGFGLIFVASGGSEGIFLSQYAAIAHRPCYILTSGESNSLAASMEILSYLQKNGQKGEILHGSASHVARRIKELQAATAALKKLSGTRAGVIGTPSDWLIASSEGGDAYQKKLGITLVSIPMAELISEAQAGGYPENDWTDLLKTQGYDPAEMEKALNVYGALVRLKDRYQLSALTVRCFDLLNTVYTTGCLGLAILNAQGIYAGCEGDVPALISMGILGAVSGQPVFLCNPSRIDIQAGEMVLAHCTLPLNLPGQIKLMTHYESGIGVAIQGDIPEATATIFKTSEALDRFFAKTGAITANLKETHLCRTQIKLKLDDFSYFLTRPISNHHLVCLGDWTGALTEFFAQIG